MPMPDRDCLDVPHKGVPQYNDSHETEPESVPRPFDPVRYEAFREKRPPPVVGATRNRWSRREYRSAALSGVIGAAGPEKRPRLNA